ncbi:hypothetical protein BDDG_00070 [Blastomyces dermatitidis ATCC 18188]|uniref:Uncharacterized protein n=1 Tax=Ajellomyces dermatitidis (strain ATCC 18188 / CBS 674.68) TaxID=653446 RepID=F2T2M3_AJEDA|nr:hypothetical protein BDDG_00070 [Blastomyces dermatitidis ATCC 18188]
MEMYTKGFTGYQPNNRLDIYIVPYQGRKNTERDEGERKKRGKKKGRAKMKKSEEVEEEPTRRRLMDAYRSRLRLFHGWAGRGARVYRIIVLTVPDRT